ncbi:LLM class flavin-dependent oxidoreductase [Jannaschia sp.]|nr:LLM class flavin-dependent oxidoreductase [Jannaschia sp.]
MTRRVEDVLGVAPVPQEKQAMRFSCLFFSDVRPEIDAAEKYRFLGDIARFADGAGFEAIYLPERHFHEFGAIHANPAIVAAHLIPQTRSIRFRTAGVTIPLHHPAEIVEWWAMNDILSGGRVDLGFGSGWAQADFIYAPDNYEDRRRLCSEGIETIRALWRGEARRFPGPDGTPVEVVVHPRPIQPELSVWLLVTGNPEAFAHAGRQGWNVFTMLYGSNLDALAPKIARYRAGRAEAGLDPDGGTVTLALHTLILPERDAVHRAVEAPLKAYIASSLRAHVEAGAVGVGAEMDAAAQAKALDYAYHRYVETAALFGSPEDGRAMVARSAEAGVDEIACLLDFGADYDTVRASLPHLGALIAEI